MPKSPIALSLLLTAIACISPFTPVRAAAPQTPASASASRAADPSFDDGKGAFATGKYPNLFAEMGHSQAESNAKVEKAYHQLFHGDLQTKPSYPDRQKRRRPPRLPPRHPAHDVRSEGMSYGMMIAVQLDKKEEFDALWNWSHTYMYHADTKHPSYGYFSWEMNYDGTAISEGAAPDGEEYLRHGPPLRRQSLAQRPRHLRLQSPGPQAPPQHGSSRKHHRPTNAAGRKIPSPAHPRRPLRHGRPSSSTSHPRSSSTAAATTADHRPRTPAADPGGAAPERPTQRHHRQGSQRRKFK